MSFFVLPNFDEVVTELFAILGLLLFYCFGNWIRVDLPFELLE